MGEAQEKLNETEFTGSSTNDLVKVVFTGNRRMKDIQINDEVVDPEDTEMLQDLIVMAVNDVLEKIDTESEKQWENTLRAYPLNFPEGEMNMQYPEPIAKLIDSYMRLPGIGQKTATRLAFIRSI